MNEENQQFKCTFSDGVCKHKQNKHKHSLACKKGGREVKSFICEGCQKSIQGKMYCCIVEKKKKRKKMFVQHVGKNLAKQQT